MPASILSLDSATAIKGISVPPTPKVTTLCTSENSNPTHRQDTEAHDHDDRLLRLTSDSNSVVINKQSPNGKTQTAQSKEQSTCRRTQAAGTRSGRESIGLAPRNRRRAFSRESVRRVVVMTLVPERTFGNSPNVWKSLKAILFASWLNILLVFIPISWVLSFTPLNSTQNKDGPILVIIFSLLAIIPLAKLLAFATEELSLRVGQTLASLLSVTLGNLIEFIVAVVALVRCNFRIVQASLAGSILSNLLMALGVCFFSGGIKYQEQGFSADACNLNSSLLTIGVIAILLPTVFHFSSVQLDDATEYRDILTVSRLTAVVLLFIYGAYLFFQLWSHATLYESDNMKVIKSTEYGYKAKKRGRKEAKKRYIQERGAAGTSQHVIPDEMFNGEPEPISPSTRLVTFAPLPSIWRDEEQGPMDDEAQIEEPRISASVTIVLLVVVAVLVAFTAQWLVDSVDGMTKAQQHILSREFVGVILLPIVGNTVEHFTTANASLEDKLTVGFGDVASSSLQIALCMTPSIVILGWILGKPMTLLFDAYESSVLFLSVMVVNYVARDGKANWLKGFILISLYFILGVTFWFYPGFDPAGALANC